MPRYTGPASEDAKNVWRADLKKDRCTVACSPEFGSDPESSLILRLASGINLGKVLLLSTQTGAM